MFSNDNERKIARAKEARLKKDLVKLKEYGADHPAHYGLQIKAMENELMALKAAIMAYDQSMGGVQDAVPEGPTSKSRSSKRAKGRG